MRAYPAYKASGLEWLWEIPAHWEVKKLKHLSTIVLGKMLTPEDKGGYYHKPYLRAKNVLWEKVDMSDVKEMWFSEQELNKYRLNLYDILISEGGEVGRTGIWRNEIEECYIQNSVHKVTINRDYNPFYFLYLFLVYGKIGHFDAIAERVSIGHLTKEKLTEIFCLVPPLAEQRAIAAYLDHKTRLIDTYIAKKQQQVERWQAYRAALINQAVTKGMNPDAPMKASGIEWLGDIPAHWTLLQLKHTANGFNNGTTATQVQNETQYKVTRIETISTGEINPEKVGYIDEKDFDEKYRLKKNDILLSHINSLEYVGNCAQIKNDDLLIHGMNLIRISPAENVDTQFLLWVLKSISFRNSIRSICKHAINQVSVPTSSLKSIKITLPPLEEQRAIAAYLDEHTAKIDTLAAATRRQLERLRAYRAALISEVVTGKIDVREELMDNQ